MSRQTEIDTEELLKLFVEGVYPDRKAAVGSCFSIQGFPIEPYIRDTDGLFLELKKQGIFVESGDLILRIRNCWKYVPDSQPEPVEVREEGIAPSEIYSEIPEKEKTIPEISFGEPDVQDETESSGREEEPVLHLARVPKKYTRFDKKIGFSRYLADAGAEFTINEICDTALFIMNVEKREMRKRVARKQDGKWSDADILWELEYNWNNKAGSGITDYTVKLLRAKKEAGKNVF